MSHWYHTSILSSGRYCLIMPGKQDVVTIWTENGDKHKEQKRILKMAIGEAYSLLVDENHDVTLGKVNLQNWDRRKFFFLLKCLIMFVGAFTMKTWSWWQGVDCILCLWNRQQEMHEFKLCLMEEQFKSAFIDEVDDAILQKNST